MVHKIKKGISLKRKVISITKKYDYTKGDVIGLKCVIGMYAQVHLA